MMYTLQYPIQYQKEVSNFFYFVGDILPPPFWLQFIDAKMPRIPL